MPSISPAPLNEELDPAHLPPGVTLTSLDNGLTIIVREDHSAPVVSAQAWCMAGSIHEGRHLGAGMSHVLEHMLFKGTRTRPGTRIDQEVQEAGGYMNAYTSFDRTVYHIDVPNTGATTALDVLCDIMQHATLPEDELEKEKQVIRREMDMNVDDPGRRASRRLFETAYTRSPVRYTVIGYPDLFNEVSREHLLEYYAEKYAPNNVFYVVAGDIRAEDAVARIRDAYANSKARALPPAVLPVEPRQTAPRQVVEEANIEIGHVHMSWHTPDSRHPDAPILDVLASLLGCGRSSRLYRSVRQAQGLVHSVDAWTYCPGGSALLGISATVNAGQFVAARDAILEVVERVKDELIPPEELGKAEKQFIASTLATRKTMQGQAQDLGACWLLANDLTFSERYLASVKRITPADLQRVAREYLNVENRTVYALLPLGGAPQTRVSSQALAEHPIQKFEMPNGLRVLLKEDHRLPFIEFRAVLRGGVLAETPANNGLTQIAGKMLLKGTTTRSADAIALAVESLGGSIDSYGGNNTFGVNAEVMGGDFRAGLELLAEVLLQPAFPEDALEREREVQLAIIRSQKDHLLQRASSNMRRLLFGEIGYGLEAVGSEQSVPTLTREDLRAWHTRLVRGDNCVLAVFGDIQPDEARRAIEAAFKGLPSPSTKPPFELPEIVFPAGVKRAFEQPDKKQAVVVIGWPGCALSNPDRYALDLLQETCSDLGSRLFLRIREQLGLAYYVGAQNLVGVLPGYFGFYAGTAPEHAERVESELLAEARLLREEGITEEELRRAKAKLIGQRKIARQDLGALAMATALDELHGLGYDNSDREDARYEAVTLDDVKAAAVKYLSPEIHVISVVRPTC